MAALVFDADGARKFETGVKNCVLFVKGSTGAYGTGVAWNGITSISESPEGGEPEAIYADDIKYLNLMSAEEFKASIEAYTYPDEFMECDGTVELADGFTVGQQPRKEFALAYKTTVGNDQNPNAGYKLHIIYGCLAAPTEKAYATVNDSPEAITFSWDISTTPIAIAGHKPSAHVELDSTVVTAAKMTTILNKIYGNDSPVSPDTGSPTLLMPSEILTILNAQG